LRQQNRRKTEESTRKTEPKLAFLLGESILEQVTPCKMF
jgi:hypothetical protein